MVVPNSTCVSLASFVVHEMTAPLTERKDAFTEEIVGAVVSVVAVDVKVKFPEVARFPAASRLFTR